jgi:hypothetical protein
MKLNTLAKGWSKAIAALLLTAFAITGAFALQVDQTRTMSKRDLFIQALHYYRLTINFNDTGISAAQAFGALGQNWYIHSIDCHVTTAFNASTTNVVTLGTTKTSANEIFGASDLNEASATVQHLTGAAGLGLGATSAADVTLWAKYAQTGTAATAGSVTCVIAYAPNNDN